AGWVAGRRASGHVRHASNHAPHTQTRGPAPGIVQGPARWSRPGGSEVGRPGCFSELFGAVETLGAQLLELLPLGFSLGVGLSLTLHPHQRLLVRLGELALEL